MGKLNILEIVESDNPPIDVSLKNGKWRISVSRKDAYRIGTLLIALDMEEEGPILTHGKPGRQIVADFMEEPYKSS